MYWPNLILRALNIFAVSIITNSDIIETDSISPTLVGLFPLKHKYLEKYDRCATASFLLGSWFNFLGLVVNILFFTITNYVEINGTE